MAQRTIASLTSTLDSTLLSPLKPPALPLNSRLPSFQTKSCLSLTSPAVSCLIQFKTPNNVLPHWNTLHPQSSPTSQISALCPSRGFSALYSPILLLADPKVSLDITRCGLPISLPAHRICLAGTNHSSRTSPAGTFPVRSFKTHQLSAH